MGSNYDKAHIHIHIHPHKHTYTPVHTFKRLVHIGHAVNNS
jgi:hypothetical protein